MPAMAALCVITAVVVFSSRFTRDQHFQHDLAGGIVQRPSRLIAQQDVGPFRHGARDRHALLFPARELRGEVVQPLAQPYQAQRLFRVERPLGDLGDQRHVLQCREAGNEVVELEHEAHVLAPEPRELLLGGAGQYVVQVVDLAAGGRIQTPEDIEQSRLAATGGAEQHHQLARIQIEIHLTQGMHFHLTHAVDLRNAVEAEDGGPAVGVSRGGGCRCFHEVTLGRRGPALVDLKPAATSCFAS